MSDHDSHEYCFLPTKYPVLKRCYEKQRDMFWVPKEIDYSGLREQFDTMTEEEQRFITFVLFFFSQSDGIVVENLVENFKRETNKYKEAKYFYAMQEAIETIHNETYSILIDVMIGDPELKMKGFDAINHYPSIKRLADWIKEFMDPTVPILERVVAFACMEGIFFSAPFCSIFWLKRSNKLAALGQANLLISADEAVHVEFAGALYTTITQEGDATPLINERIHEIIMESVVIEKQFVDDALNVDLIGMTSIDMNKYVECCADEICLMFGAPKKYNTTSPFPWMSIISLPAQANFFETRIASYNRPQDEIIDGDFDFEEDF